MKNNHKKIVLEIICTLYAILFTYAAASKLIDYQQFEVQLGKSPLLSAYAYIIVWAVPFVEIVISLLLFFPKLRLIGLFASFFLMVMFTTYIIVILNFSDYVPCSCGGVLEKMGWTEHLIFNIAFIVLAFIGIWITSNEKYNTAQNYLAFGKGHKREFEHQLKSR